MADETVVAPPPLPEVPIIPETEAEQQARQEASLAPEELAALDAERRENARKQAERDAAKQSLTLEGLAEELGELRNRVEALEQAASSSLKSSSKSSTSSSSKSSDSGTTTTP